MLPYLALGAGLLAAGTPAAPADTVAIAPPPAWVVTHPVPADSNDPSTAGARFVLRDNQTTFDRDGVQTMYWDDATKVLTPEGLMQVAAVALSWNPETDAMTVHRIHIIRGEQVIDVLKTQQFTVLHRETALERAAIDGRLTASLQIAGLQVGDIVEICASRRHHDPALGTHVESSFTFRPTTIETRLEAHWPTAVPIRWRAMPGLPTPGQTANGARTTLSMTIPNLREPILPKGAPVRFLQANVMQFSDWTDWSQISTLMTPLYAKAATLAPGSAVAAEAAKIAAASSDPVTRAESALALVQDQVRYLYVGLNDGGYVPAAADDTWQRRYGDCKGKTALLLAMLHALGIEAQPVLVNATGFGDAIPRYLPAAGLFNHVLVRATIAGRAYWLDGTRMGDRHLAAIQTPPFRWGLPIQAAGATLVPMMPEAATRPLGTMTIRLDASAGFDKPVPAQVEIVERGDGAIGLHRQLDGLTAQNRERVLKTMFRNGSIPLASTNVTSRFDPTNGTETVTTEGTATLDFQDGALELTNMQLGAAVDFTREPGPDADAPFAVRFPVFGETRETIVLPDNGKGFTLDPMAFDRTIAGITRHREGAIVDGVVKLAISDRSIAPEFPARDAPAAQQELRQLSHRHVYLRRAPS